MGFGRTGMLNKSPAKDTTKTERENSIRAMLAGLDDLAPREQSRRLRSLVSKLQATESKPEKRLATSDVVYEKCSELVHTEGQRFIGLTLPLSTRDQATVANFMRALATLDATYAACFDALTDKNRAGEEGLRDLVGRTLMGQIQCSLDAVLLCAAAYMTWPNGIWKTLHRVYRHAKQLKLDDWSNPKDPSGLTIADRYALALMIGLSDPYKMPFRGIFTGTEMLTTQLSAVTIGPVSSSNIDQVLFEIDPREDRPGKRLPTVGIEGLSGKTDVLDLSRLLLILGSGQKLPEIDIREDILGATDNTEFLLKSVREHLKLTLGVKTSRSVERTDDDSEYEIVTGLDELKLVARGGVVKEAESGLASELWLDGAAPEAVVAAPEGHLMSQGVDISANGIRVELKGGNHRNIRTSDLIAVRRRGNGGGAWICGVVRWNQVLNKGEVQIGVEFIKGHITNARINTMIVDGAPDQFAERDCVVVVRDDKFPARATIIADSEYEVLRRYQISMINGTKYALSQHKKLGKQQSVTYLSVILDPIKAG